VYTKNNSWNDVYNLAFNSYDPEDPPQVEFLSLIQAAKDIYSKKSRRKSKKPSRD
jgi:hypothetical protein